MKITKKTELAGGRVRLTIELAEGESLRAAPKGRTLIEIDDSLFYRLGEPMDEVFQGHILANAEQVVWCPIAQKWVA